MTFIRWPYYWIKYETLENTYRIKFLHYNYFKKWNHQNCTFETKFNKKYVHIYKQIIIVIVIIYFLIFIYTTLYFKHFKIFKNNRISRKYSERYCCTYHPLMLLAWRWKYEWHIEACMWTRSLHYPPHNIPLRFCIPLFVLGIHRYSPCCFNEWIAVYIR